MTGLIRTGCVITESQEKWEMKQPKPQMLTLFVSAEARPKAQEPQNFDLISKAKVNVWMWNCLMNNIPFPQGLQTAHPAQDQLRILFVHVNLLVISHQGVLPLMKLLIPSGLDFLKKEKYTQ